MSIYNYEKVFGAQDMTQGSPMSCILKFSIPLLLGNHELMMCRAVYKPATDAALNLWFKNGGKPTYEAWKKLTFPEQVEIIYKLQRCPLNTQIEIGGKTVKIGAMAKGSGMMLETSQVTSSGASPIRSRSSFRSALAATVVTIFSILP